MSDKPPRADIDTDKFRRRLVAERKRILGLADESRADLLDESGEASGDDSTSFSATNSEETDDTAAILVDQERFQAMDANERDLLKEIDSALRRLDDGTYGYSEISGDPIPIERLNVIPWAATTVKDDERLVG